MAGRNLSYEEWVKLSEHERGERYKDLPDEDKYRIRISINPGARSVRCNSCRYYQGFAKCVAFPAGISKIHIDAVDRDAVIECGNGLHYERKI